MTRPQCVPTDIWNWAGLAGDAVDLILPVVTGVGETIRATRATNKAVNNVTKVSKHTTKEITEVANKLEGLSGKKQEAELLI